LARGEQYSPKKIFKKNEETKTKIKIKEKKAKKKLFCIKKFRVVNML